MSGVVLANKLRQDYLPCTSSTTDNLVFVATYGPNDAAIHQCKKVAVLRNHHRMLDTLLQSGNEQVGLVAGPDVDNATMGCSTLFTGVKGQRWRAKDVLGNAGQLSLALYPFGKTAFATFGLELLQPL